MNPIVIVTVVCILTGGVLAAIMEDKSVALLIIGIATASLIPALLKQQEEVKRVTKEAKDAHKRADEAFEQTATLRADLLKKKPPAGR